MLRRLAGPLREFGVGAGLLYLLHRALQALSPRCGVQVYELMAQPVPAEPLLPAARTRALRFAEIGAGDPLIERMPARPEIKAARLANGNRCLGAWRNEQLIGYVWFAFDHYLEDEVRCTYELAAPAQSAFDFDFYLLPEHRMGTAFAAVWHGANEFLRELGVRHTFSRMTRFNTASRRAHARLGALRLSSAVFVQLWRVELMLATQAPFVALTASPGRRVHLRLDPPPTPAVRTRDTSIATP